MAYEVLRSREDHTRCHQSVLLIFYQSLLLNCRLDVLHKVNNLVKEWIRDISIKKVCQVLLHKLM